MTRPRTPPSEPGPPQLSEETRLWLAETPVEKRKQLGQYMTPRLLRERLLDHLDLSPGMRVLDPGCGTGEFLRSVLDRESEAHVVGWDIDPTVLAVARRLVPEAELTERSALNPYLGQPFDLVIGNPPYFQFKASREVETYFARVISGRPNIFALFFQSGIEALRPNGMLAYVVPPSMNNGAYFEALRGYLMNQAAIAYLEVFANQGLFDSAQTPVQLIALRRGASSEKHVFSRTSADGSFRRNVFTASPELIAREFEGRSTLFELGYEAVTGTIVWNQNRERLRRHQEPGTVPLIWAHNITGNGISLDDNHSKRPQYVVADYHLNGPAVVLNRIVGAVGAGDLRCAQVPEGFRFLGENHVNVIRLRPDKQPRCSWDALLGALKGPRVCERVRLLTGNTQVSATELTHLLPLDL